ncbi:MAG TPA: glycosyltransferase [Pseudomonadales bacterium]|nr:glycosyltransferase [Pseudomonadales bacterium]
MPKLSIIVVVYRMSRQAMNTLYSLSARYQRNVNEADYEIVVMENLSTDNLDPAAVQALGGNIRHYQRTEPSPSPVNAINEGFREARAPFIGLIIDGARMVTPRVVEYALVASRMSANALVAVPAFNLGPHLHYQHIDCDYGEAQEQQMLEQTAWQDNGYRLFDVGNLGEANPRGIFQPFLENNCYFTSRDNFAAIGYADERFQYPGGGSLNLHMFRSIGMLPQCEPYCVMAGEGTFHQFHGGVTTAQVEGRTALLTQFREQLESIWHGRFPALEREPFLIGAATSHAQRLLHYSSVRGQKRFNRLHEKRCIFCQDDRSRSHFYYQSDSSDITRCDPR